MKQPHLHCVEKDVNDYCIVVGDPGRVLRIVEKLSNVKKVSEYRGYRVYNGEFKGVPITVASTGIGGPSAAIAVEELIKCGAKTIIRVGSGGVMQKEINTGDLIISTGVCKEEKGTQEYVPAGFAAVPNYDVLNALIESAKELGHKFYYGITMCCDAFYAEKHRKLMKEWGSMGVIGSEMESSMVFTLAQLRGVRAGMIFYTGLNVVKKQGPKDIAKQQKERMAGESRAVMVALNAVKKLEEVG